MKKNILSFLFSICSFLVFSQGQSGVKTKPFQALENKVQMNIPVGWQDFYLFKEGTDHIIVSDKITKDPQELKYGILISREKGLSEKLNLSNNDANLSQGIVIARKAEYEKMYEFELRSEKAFQSGSYSGIIQEIKYRKTQSGPLLQEFVLTYVHNNEAFCVRLIAPQESFDKNRNLFWEIIRSISIN